MLFYSDAVKIYKFFIQCRVLNLGFLFRRFNYPSFKLRDQCNLLVVQQPPASVLLRCSLRFEMVHRECSRFLSGCLPQLFQGLLVWGSYKFGPSNTPKRKSQWGLNQASMEATQHLHTKKLNVKKKALS